MRHVAGYVIAGLAFAGLALMTSPVMAAGHSSRGCSNCHVPHQAAKPTDQGASYGVPLWSPTYTADSPATYSFTLYSSPSFDALGTDIDQPDGPSKLCLGCHDGTYSHVSSNRSFGPGGAMDFAHSHPLSFTYDATLAAKTNSHTGALKNPVTTPSGISATGSIDQDMLYNHKMQCTTCHDVHTTADPNSSDMLRKNFTAGGGSGPDPLCITCHEK